MLEEGGGMWDEGAKKDETVRSIRLDGDGDGNDDGDA